MDQPRISAEPLARDGRPRRESDSPAGRPRRGNFVGLGLKLALVGVILAGGSGTAQTPPAAGGPVIPPTAQLTVRPREMAIGPKPTSAGEEELDDEFTVYVPKACAGVQCPLVVVIMHGIGPQRDLADKYGAILLESRINVNNVNGWYPDQVKSLDAALKKVLEKYAIDPHKIAVTGSSDGGNFSMFVARNNPEVFSRAAPHDAALWEGMENPPHTPPGQQFYMSTGIADFSPVTTGVWVTQELRQAGHAATPVLNFRGHWAPPEDWRRIWRWFYESWAAPDSTAKAVPPTPDSLPVLTTEALTKLRTFGEILRPPFDSMQEPDTIALQKLDSIRTAMTARDERWKEITIPVGQEQMVLRTMDLPALAAEYPSIAAALKAADLTAQQAEAYRIAFASAFATVLFEKARGWGAPHYAKRAEEVLGTIAETSVLGRNVTFIKAQDRGGDGWWGGLGEVGQAVMWDIP